MDVAAQPFAGETEVFPRISTLNQGKLEKNRLVIEETLLKAKDRVSVEYGKPEKALSISADKIIKALNKLLEDKLPEGIESLKPEETTPEATADRIVKGATAFFDIYAAQNPDLEGQELLDGFMETIRSGIKQGYEEAFSILEGLGAFEFEGVQSGIEKTKELIEQKLSLYEKQKSDELGLGAEAEEESKLELSHSQPLKE